MRADQARAWSARTDRWRYVYWQDEPEQLYDLANDPGELQDLGRSPAHEAVRAEMRARLLEWSLGRKTRVTIADSAIERSTNAHKRAGIHFGQW
ncbi:sulfatase [Bordetella pertussis]|nr:sulfatase [Bordetella pertussis]